MLLPVKLAGANERRFFCLRLPDRPRNWSPARPPDTNFWTGLISLLTGHRPWSTVAEAYCRRTPCLPGTGSETNILNAPLDPGTTVR